MPPREPQRADAAADGRRRELGLTSAVALVVANMIGAGVFTTSGFALADLGSRSAVLWAWVVGGILALCGALCYGALGRHMPESGGEYYFLSRTVHPAAGFLAGWTSLLAGFTAPIAVAAMALGAYLVPGGEAGDTATGQRLVGTVAIVAAAAMHGLRLRPGLLLQNLAVGLKLLLIVAFLGLGAAALLGSSGPGPAASAPPADVAPSAFAVTLIWITFSYSGWNAAVYVGGEIRRPERTLPLALIVATLLVTALYLALNAVFVHAAPIEELAGRADVAAVAARALGGEGLVRFVQAIISVALFTSICSMVMAGPRVYARMAADGCFPKALAFRGEVPAASVALQCLGALGVLWVSSLASLLGYVGFTLGLSSAATVAALMVARMRGGEHERIWVPGYPLVPVVYLVGVLGASVFMAQREPLEAGVGLLTVLSGLPVYLWYRRSGALRD